MSFIVFFSGTYSISVLGVLLISVVKFIISIFIFFLWVTPVFSQLEREGVFYKYVAFDDLLSQINNDQKIEIYLDSNCSIHFLNLLTLSKEEQSDIKLNLFAQAKIQKLCAASSLEEIKKILGPNYCTDYENTLRLLEEGNVFLLPQYYQIYESLNSFGELLKVNEDQKKVFEGKIANYYAQESVKLRKREEATRQAKLKKYYQANTKNRGVVEYRDGDFKRNLILSPEGRYVLKLGAKELEEQEKELLELIEEKKRLTPLALGRIRSIYSRDNSSWTFVKSIKEKDNKLVLDLSSIDIRKMSKTLESKIDEIKRIDLDVERTNGFKNIYEMYNSKKYLEVDEEMFVGKYFKKMPSGTIIYDDIYAQANQEYLKNLVKSQRIIAGQISHFWISDKPNTYIVFNDGRYKEIFIADYYQEETIKNMDHLEKYGWILKNHYQSIFDEFYKKITQQEAVSIHMYTGALYNDINQCLRNENCPKDLADKVKNINSAIQKLSKSGLMGITVFRGVENLPLQIVEKLENEDTNLVVDTGFQSTTTNAEIAKRFAKRASKYEKSRFKNHLFVMKVKSCVSIERLSYVQKEDEYLCPPGLHYSVKKHPTLHNVYMLSEN